MSGDEACKLRFLIFGTGAIGSYIGISLLISGQEVVFLEQIPVVEEIRHGGLELLTGKNQHHVENVRIVPTIDQALTYGPFDVSIVAVKSFDTANLIQTIAPYRAALPPILTFQNGVDNEEMLAREIGPDKVISGTITSAIGKTGTGKVILEKLRGIGVGSTHMLVPSLVSVFNEAGLNPRMYSNPLAMKWSKMLTNLVANATSAILDMTPVDIYSHRGLCQLEMLQLQEAIRVMSAQNIPVVNLPGTPVKTLAWGIQHLPLSIAQPILKRMVGGGRGDKMPSFHIDLHSKRGKSEVEFLNGAVFKYGQQFGITTPINKILNEVLLGLTSGEIDIGAFRHQPEKLLSMI